MRLFQMKHVIVLMLKFIAVETFVTLILLLTLFTASVTSQVLSKNDSVVLSNKDSPLRVQKHPSTYFDATKPVFNQFENYGIHMVLPIGQALSQCKEAIVFAGAIPKDTYVNYAPASSSINHNNISTSGVKVPPTTYWHNTMVRMVHIKEKNVKNKVNGVLGMLEANAVPAEDFVQAINLHHAATYHARNHHSTSARFYKRSIDLNLDLASTVTAFFTGVSSIFHFRAINEVASAVSNLQVKQVHLSEFTQDFASHVAQLLTLMDKKEKQDIHTTQTAFATYMVLDKAEKLLDMITQAISPLLQGILPTLLINPKNLVDLYNKVDKEARKNGLQIALADPTEILTLVPFTYQRGDNFEVLLSVPVIHPKNQFSTYKLINLPALKDGIPMIWDLNDVFFGLHQTLYPEEAEYIIIKTAEIHQVCRQLLKMYLCKTPTITKPSCVSDLYHGLSNNCQTRSPSLDTTIMPVSKNNLFFFENVTNLLIKCQEGFDKLQVSGLIQVQDKANCQLITENFAFTLPGDNPRKVFDATPIKIVSIDLMTNISEPVQDDIEKSIDNLTETINAFEASGKNLETVQVPSIWNYASLSVGLVALTTSLVLVVFFVYKCRQVLPPMVPPAVPLQDG